MPAKRTPRPRRSGGLIGDTERHLEEWVQTLEELDALTDEELDDLIRLVANDDDADDKS